MTLRTGTKYETEMKHILEQRYVVLNLSQSEPGDLILPEPEVREIHEVKSCKGDVFRLSHPKERKQCEKLIKLCRDIDYDLYYDIKFLGKGWQSVRIGRLFTSISVDGRVRYPKGSLNGSEYIKTSNEIDPHGDNVPVTPKVAKTNSKSVMNKNRKVKP